MPISLGDTTCTGITLVAYRNLTQHLEFQVPEPNLVHKVMQIVEMDERVLKRFDVDFRGIYGGSPDNWEDIQIDEETYQDRWGLRWRKPPTSFYYDLVHSPLAGTITTQDIASYPWPDPTDPGQFRDLKSQVEHWKTIGDYALVLNLGLGTIDQSQFMRGFEDWYIDSALNPHLLGALMDVIQEFNLAVVEQALELVGDDIDIFFFGDDIATQSGPMISPEAYRSLIRPYQEKMFGFVHDHTDAKILYHTCGSVYGLLEDFIGVGVDIINPVQVSATDMDTDRLKGEFGDRLSFWGGIDSQSVLPKGTVEDVGLEVEQRISDLAPGGGYVLNPVHNIQPDVPPANVVAMYDHGKEVGSYPIRVPRAEGA